MASGRRYTFGEYTLDLGRGALLKAGADVKLRPKSFEVLRLLVQRHGQLVSKDELLNAVWSDVVVTDGAVGQCLIDVRRAIGDESQQVIRTVPRRGYIFDIPVVESEAAESESTGGATVAESLWRRRAVGFGLTALALVLLVSAIWWLKPPHTAIAPRTPNSIAVLPFVNMSPEPDQEYFSDGISEEILNLLAQTRGLHVTARTSSFSFKGKNATVAKIAQDLGVTHVLEGSVRKTGDRVRITAQLIDSATSRHLWSQTYDRTLDDILAVQTDIARSVTQALKIKLLGAAAGPAPPKNAEAYERFLQGQFFFGRRSKGDMERATAAFREALAIDPDFARAWAGLAGATWISLSSGEMSRDVGLPKLRIAAAKAVQLDPNMAEGHFRLANFFWSSHEPEAARVHYRKAMELAPDSPLMLSSSAMDLADEGDLDAAIGRYARVVALDPLSASQRHNYGTLLFAAGRHREARAQLLKEADLNPEAERGTLGLMLILEGEHAAAESWFRESPDGLDRDQGLAMVHHALGRAAESDAALARLTERLSSFDHPKDAEVHAYRGDIDAAFRALSRNLADSDFVSPSVLRTRSRINWDVRFSPFLEPLHADPRWQALTRMPLPQHPPL